MSRSSFWVGKVASPRSVTSRASRELETPPVSQAASWVVVTGSRVGELRLSEECADNWRQNRRRSRTAAAKPLTLTGLPNLWIGLRGSGFSRNAIANARGKPF